MDISFIQKKNHITIKKKERKKSTFPNVNPAQSGNPTAVPQGERGKQCSSRRAQSNLEQSGLTSSLDNTCTKD